MESYAANGDTCKRDIASPTVWNDPVTRVVAEDVCAWERALSRSRQTCAREPIDLAKSAAAFASQTRVTGADGAFVNTNPSTTLDSSVIMPRQSLSERMATSATQGRCK